MTAPIKQLIDPAPPTVDLQHVLSSLPRGTHVTWQNDTSEDGEWRVQPGSSNNIGHGDTLRRALQMVNAQMVPNPNAPGSFIYVNQAGEPIEDIELPPLPEPPPPPEAETLPAEPANPLTD